MSSSLRPGKGATSGRAGTAKQPGEEKKKKKHTSSDNKHRAWAAGAISDTPVTHRVLLQALPLPLPSTDSSEFVFSTIIFSQLNNV